MKIPDRTLRIEQTRERFSKLFEKAVEIHGKELGFNAELAPIKNPIREFLIEQLVAACDETGFFIAYVGD